MRQKKIFQWNIKIPDNVILKKQQNQLFIIGPLGTNKADLNKLDPSGNVAMNLKKDNISFCSASKPFFRAFSSALTNKIYGVTRGYLTYLRISGIGYRCVLEKEPINKKNQILRLKVGFSHDLIFQIPESIKLFLIEPTLICLYGVDKNQITQIASKIREIQPPSVYKGKGIAFSSEVVKLKQGKRK